MNLPNCLPGNRNNTQATAADFRGLDELARLAGRRFRAGVVLYLGRRVVPFAKNLHAVPMAALWEW